MASMAADFHDLHGEVTFGRVLRSRQDRVGEAH